MPERGLVHAGTGLPAHVLREEEVKSGGKGGRGQERSGAGGLSNWARRERDKRSAS